MELGARPPGRGGGPPPGPAGDRPRRAALDPDQPRHRRDRPGRDRRPRRQDRRRGTHPTAAGRALFRQRDDPGRRSAATLFAFSACCVRSWGDAVAAVTVAVYAALAWRLRIATPDFVYHWGLKGHRYYLTGGIDWAFLTDPLHLTDHPDYPNLLPNLYAATAVAAGRFSERAMMGWSVVAFALILVAARECWARTATAGPLRQAGVATLALGVGMFAVGYQEAGGADWWIALALVAALPPLLAPAASYGLADDLAVGLAAALAAGGKMEGVPLALFIVVLHLARRATAARRLAVPTALRTALPPLLVIAPWLWANLRLGLFQPADAGVLALGRSGVIFPAVAAALATPEWHGLAWSVLLLPVLVAARPTRPLGLLVGAQALLYLYIYFSTPLPPDAYILASLPRLLFHLVPAILVGVAILAAATARGRDDR